MKFKKFNIERIKFKNCRVQFFAPNNSQLSAINCKLYSLVDLKGNLL